MYGWTSGFEFLFCLSLGKTKINSVKFYKGIRDPLNAAKSASTIAEIVFLYNFVLY